MSVSRLCNAQHPDERTRCTLPGGLAHDDHEDLDGRRWADDEVVIDVVTAGPEVLHDLVDDVPAEVWVIRGALGLLGAAGLLVLSAFGFAVASIWTSAVLSDRLESSAWLCLAAGGIAAVCGWAGVQQALPRPVAVELDDDGSLPVPPPVVKRWDAPPADGPF